MNGLIDWLSQPWPWYVAGPLIAVVMLVLLYQGNNLGISSNLRTMCSALGAGKSCDFFAFNWKAQWWNLVFVLGLIIGGFLSSHFLIDESRVAISTNTIEVLRQYGFTDPAAQYVPEDIFSWEGLLTLKGFVLMVIGGFLVGFGTRYAGGCTSGHAISGLSNLQLPSLIAVVGFFVGGLITINLFFPLFF